MRFPQLLCNPMASQVKVEETAKLSYISSNSETAQSMHKQVISTSQSHFPLFKNKRKKQKHCLWKLTLSEFAVTELPCHREELVPTFPFFSTHTSGSQILWTRLHDSLDGLSMVQLSWSGKSKRGTFPKMGQNLWFLGRREGKKREQKL